MTLPTAPIVATRGPNRSISFKDDRALVEQLQQRCGGEVRKGALHASHGATEFRLSFLPKRQGCVVSVACPFAGRFRITRKGALDRWMEGFVPALPFRARDPRFARDFNVQTRDVRFASDVLAKPPSLASVRSLFDHGVQSVHLRGDRIETVVPRKALGKDPAAKDVLVLVERLARIGDAVAAVAARHEARAAPKHDPAVVFAWTTLGLLGALGFALLLVGSQRYTLVSPARFLLPCALLGLPAVGPAVVLLTLAVRRRTAPYGLVRGLAGVSLVTVPLFVSGALLVVNGFLDDSPAEEHAVQVVGKDARKNKNQWSYSAGLASWWSAEGVRWVRVSRSTYDRIEPNESRMQVTTHPGRLGYAWIESYALLP